jgi:chlorophyll synthase
MPDWRAVALGVCLTGPLVCGTSQAVNDWFDRHVDAVNEPARPIPSGRVGGTWGLVIALLWSGLSLGAAALLGSTALIATLIGLSLAWAYSAPPFRFKRNGWIGNLAVGISYEGLAWVTGTAVALGGSVPPVAVFLVALAYSLGAHGIMTINDFKSIEGDQRFGIGSLPVRLGPALAARVACAVMLLPQVAVVGYIFRVGHLAHASVILALVLLQLPLMARWCADPRRLAPWYNATGVTAYVLGMLTAAFALRGGV